MGQRNSTRGSVDIEGIAERMSYHDCHVGNKWAGGDNEISQPT